MSLEVSKYLSLKNNPDTWMKSRSCDDFVVFDCPYCTHEYRATVVSVFKGAWCNCRKRKTETKLYDFLVATFLNKTIEKNVKFDWCVNEETGRLLPFDFCVDGCIIIELDGGHHFSDINVWKSNAIERQERDIFKMTHAFQNGARVIRLYQSDVWKNKNDWAAKLKALIEDDSQQLSFVSTDNQLVTDTYAMYAEKWKQLFEWV